MKKTAKEVSVPTQTHVPMNLISEAVAKGTDLVDLERLLSLQERWEQNEARKAYHKAMAEFKAVPIHIEKDKKVGYASSKGGRVGYSYASLANVVDKISAELSKHGLSASWRTKQNGEIIVTCRITHSKGHYEETSLSAAADSSGAKNSIQALGSTVSYLSRYTLLSLTGLAAADSDDDGQTVVELLDENKVRIIKELLAVVEIEEAKFLEYMQVEKVEDIKKSNFGKAKVLLEQKRKKT